MKTIWLGKTLLVFLFSLGWLGVFAQNQAIKFANKQLTIDAAFDEIERQTNYTVAYTDAVIDVSKTVELQNSYTNLTEALNAVLKGTGAAFKFRDTQILIVAEEKTLSANKTITGKVTDSKGETLPAVNIIIKGTNQGVFADINGNFTITIPTDIQNPVLRFVFMGYLETEQEIGNRNTLNVSLTEDISKLDEVVVVGYGTQKKVNLTGAISSVSAEKLENRPITNATQALQGVQGIYVNQAGGQPGKDGATIRIRGQGTLNNNDPLILVDGIEFPLSAVNPNDIESVSVLKDAASAAIYGSRAANGVILVKTKGGKKGGFQVDYNNYFGVQQVTYLPDVVKDPILFMETRNIAQINEGKLITDFATSMIEEYKAGMKTDPFTYPQNDWFKIMFKDAFVMEHNVRFSGGDEKYTFSMSVGYNKQDGVLLGTNAEKYTIAFNSIANINTRLKVGASFNGSFNKMNAPAAGVPQLMEMTFKAQGYHPTYLEDGRYANTFVRTPGHNVFRHPLALAQEGGTEQKNQYVLINLFSEYKLPLDITYKLNVGINKRDYLESRFVPDIYLYQVKTQETTRVDYGGLQRGVKRIDNNDMNKTIFQTLNWSKKTENGHQIQTLLGFSYEDSYISKFDAQREGYLGNTLTELNAGSTNPAVSGTSSKSAILSYFGRLNYDWKDKYLFEANFRYDGSSRFAKGHRWGLFPSFSAGWRIEQEDFMKEITWIDNLKLRTSWGQLGNERIELFRYIDLISLGENYPFNGKMYPGAAVNAYNDPEITWETTTMTNVGIDVSLFKRKLDIVFELFNKETSDILRPVNLPAQVGALKGPIRNIGTVQNKGYEIGLTYRNNLGDFRYEMSGNVTYVKNKIIDLKGQTIVDGMFILKEGYPIDSYSLIHSNGIFQSLEEVANSPFQTANTKAGYLKYEDINQDNKITEDDRQISKGIIPSYTYSFNLNLGYKNFELTAFFQGVEGVYTYGDRINATPFWFGTGLPTKWLTDSWTPDRRNAPLPILTTYEGSLNENFRKNDFWLWNASYLRLKNVQLSYNVPKKVLDKIGINKLKVFINGQNLFTWSEMDQFDPEKDLKNSNWYEYPSVKTYTAGINLTF